MALKKSQRSLKNWTKQDGGTKSGKKSSKTGERYLPKAARKALSPAEYAATEAKFNISDVDDLKGAISIA